MSRADAMVPLPPRGRRFTATRRVRLGDADAIGRLRLDALARYLQDVASDDSDDAGLPDAGAWVTRRVVLDIAKPPRLGEPVSLTTFCGGVGPRWAERRTSLVGEQGGRVEAATLWVYVDLATGGPVPLPERFHELYREAAAGRRVSGRLHHEAPPPDVVSRDWPMRATDFDVLGHANNAAYWEAVEDELARASPSARVRGAELEYRGGLDPGEPVELATSAEAASEASAISVWFLVGGEVRASAVVQVESADVRP
jgi:acyl-ACP thioesterase